MSSIDFSEEGAGNVGFGLRGQGLTLIDHSRWECGAESGQAGKREEEDCGDCLGHDG